MIKQKCHGFNNYASAFENARELCIFIAELFPGKIAATVFSLNLEFKENTQGLLRAEGSKI